MILRLLLVLCLGACSAPGYYLQAMSGQKKLMQSRQDIQTLLNDPETPAELAGHLKTAEQIKAFAQNELGLPSTVATPAMLKSKARRWCGMSLPPGNFPCSRKSGVSRWPVACPTGASLNNKKHRIPPTVCRHKGMDVIVSPAAAYSSLGWFNDPLLSTMFSGSDTRLAAYLFHELAHQRLYIKNDGLFNEGYASFVEETGVRAWLEFNQQQDELTQMAETSEGQQRFFQPGRENTNPVGRALSQQGDRYCHAYRRKLKFLVRLRHDYQRLSDEKWQGKRYYSAWFQGTAQ